MYHVFEYILFILKYNKAKRGKAVKYLGRVFQYNIRKVLKYLSMVYGYFFIVLIVVIIFSSLRNSIQISNIIFTLKIEQIWIRSLHCILGFPSCFLSKIIPSYHLTGLLPLTAAFLLVDIQQLQALPHMTDSHPTELLMG